MGEKTKKKATKEVAKVTGSNIVIFNDLFGDIDFSTLNGSIESLAKASGTLGEDEKRAATDILHQWEENVLERLEDRKSDIENFLNFLAGREHYGYRYEYLEDEMGMDAFADLSKKTKTMKEFKSYLEAKEAFETFLLNAPEEPVDDVTVSYEDKELERREYELLRTKYEIGKKKASRKIILTRRTWIKALVANEEVRKLMGNLASYKRKLNKFKGDCKAKSQNARLNVAISSQEVREAIKELLDFAIEI